MWPFLTLLALLVGAGAAGWFWSVARRALIAESTSRRELEELRRSRHLRLAEVETKQEAVFNGMVEGLLILDEDGRVQFANPALGQLFDLPQEVRGRSLLETLRLHELQTLAQRAQVEGRVTGYEIQLPGEPNRVIQVNAATVRDSDRALVGTILVFHDLSRIKQLESVRKEFVANVSHELRTPLSLIKGYVETLLDGAKDDPVVATRFLHTIEKHADRLTFLIDDLLTISQLESGQVAFNLQSLNLREQVEQVLNELGGRGAEKRVTVLNEVPDHLLVRADGDRLQQVLFNLIDNALKYGHPDGTIRIGGKQLSADRTEGWVADDGPGIPVEAQNRVFERFFRVDRARSREQGGTGLGLSIVKHIIQSHGGEVGVESHPGKGTIFTFSLPAAVSEADSDRASAPE